MVVARGLYLARHLYTLFLFVFVQGSRRESREKEELGKFFLVVLCIFVIVCICFCICARKKEEQGERGFGKVLKLEGDRTFSSAPQRITSV